VLAAHAACLAHRYGAGAAQLDGGLDVRALLWGRRAYASAWSAAAGGMGGGPPPGVAARRRGGPQGGGGGAAATAAAAAAALRDRQCPLTDMVGRVSVID